MLDAFMVQTIQDMTGVDLRADFGNRNRRHPR